MAKCTRCEKEILHDSALVEQCTTCGAYFHIYCAKVERPGLIFKRDRKLGLYCPGCKQFVFSMERLKAKVPCVKGHEVSIVGELGERVGFCDGCGAYVCEDHLFVPDDTGTEFPVRCPRCRYILWYGHKLY